MCSIKLFPWQLRVRAEARIGLKNPPEESKARMQSETVVREFITAEAIGVKNDDSRAIIREINVMMASTTAPYMIET